MQRSTFSIIFLYIFLCSLMMSAKKEPCVEGEALELLKQLLQDGYVYTGKNRNKLRFLQKNFLTSIVTRLLFPALSTATTLTSYLCFSNDLPSRDQVNEYGKLLSSAFNSPSI